MRAYGVDGDNIVCNPDGRTGHGYLYDGATWTRLAFPGTEISRVYDIDGDNIVGGYRDASGTGHGFIYTIPEPTTLLLLALGGFALLHRRRGV
ncbi:MAG: PEP-CTERM sorting domain-containing protein [Planctomycetota bacterium]|jgi:hypothetical protein